MRVGYQRVPRFANRPAAQQRFNGESGQNFHNDFLKKPRNVFRIVAGFLLFQECHFISDTLFSRVRSFVLW
ncbi:hypothetical protein Hanom_Chr13g01242771 [Helianthus anomalus]